MQAKPRFSIFSRNGLFVLLTVLFGADAIWSVPNIIGHTQASTKAIEQVFSLYSLKNEGAQNLQHFDKEHPFLGMFVSGAVEKTLKLSSASESNEALGPDLQHAMKTIRVESASAAWWSWFLLSFSFLYIVMVVVLERTFTGRSVLFALTAVSFTFFLIGILAPAMVIWTTPKISLGSGAGDLEFVIQHQVRGIAAIIWELFTADHWIIGGFLLLFSIVTPLTKASLTVVATFSRSQKLNYRIGQFLHAIGKWSMADVFVAAILLALYALKFQEATKSIPCLGLYYFIGYCLLSMTTTELLVHSPATDEKFRKTSARRLGLGAIGGLVAALICFVAASSLYTYQQYTEHEKKAIKADTAPTKLNNSDLVLPAHK